MRLARLLRLAEGPMLVEQVRLVLASTSTSVIPTFLLVALLLYALSGLADALWLALWAAAQLILKVFYAWAARQRLLAGIDEANAQRTVMWLLVLNAIDGLVWGALPVIALDGATMAGSILVIAVMAGVAGTAVATLAALPAIFVVFVSVMLVELAAKLLLMRDPAFNALAGAGALYIVMLVLQSRSSSAAIRSVIQLRFENVELIQRLRVETDNAQAAYREAEQANLAKSRFLAAASHDLRQPIHAQGLFLSVLGRTALTDVQRQVLASATTASKASAEMLNTLLDFSRVEAGVVEPQRKAFRLQPLFNTVENDLAPQADAKGIVYRTHETPVALYSDPGMVEMILRNLVSNAIRYSERGGVLIGCRRRGNMATIEVWDTGIGIDPGQHQEIFREFHQLGNPERDRRKGLGLGLAIAQGMARRLGDPLSLRSQPGRGSVFRLTLPVAHDPVPEPASARHPGEMLIAGARVLLVDDDESVRSGMFTLLTDWGCVCDTAETIEEALMLARANPPDVIISDYRLRELHTGSEAIRQLRTQQGRTIPALLITGDTAPERLREAAASGVPLLHKPLWPTDLYLGLLAVLDPGAFGKAPSLRADVAATAYRDSGPGALSQGLG